jgi:hypothetical protein
VSVTERTTAVTHAGKNGYAHTNGKVKNTK